MESEKTKRIYNRIAPVFDGIEGFFEGLFVKRWRNRLWSKVQGKHILEVGVGTGKNFAYYPIGRHITGIDFSPGMLQQARRKKQHLRVVAELEEMDVERLCYAENSFDTVVATFVFCSVPKPRKGLRELHRVCKPGGEVILLEHVISSNKRLAKVMNFLNPWVHALIGANINRDTVKNVKACGFKHVKLDSASTDMVKLIQAIK